MGSKRSIIELPSETVEQILTISKTERRSYNQQIEYLVIWAAEQQWHTRVSHAARETAYAKDEA